MGREEDGDPNRENPGPPNRTHHHQGKREEEEEMKLWGVLAFGLIGATATTLAQVSRLRQTVNWVYAQLTRSHESAKSFRTAFQEEAWKRYNRRMQEAYEEEMERVERIRRMQSVFNRERSKYNRGYESWKENDGGAYTQQFQRDDWYWKADTSSRYRSTNFRRAPRENASYPLSHHYSVLGLDRSRKTPYTDAEIKTAFRAKALEFHPDQNQDNKVAAEAKFKEVMVSYEAIKRERENN
ncbi:dnaJ homolog subfamily C member 7 homolog isoform X1 [Syzygium oleosum]|uniref:dnaJ homolog subfamily C member 7 homolog isoform X1 n=1 Tax=Syzygium oleosum TaxID=219896 RepID=UPI0024BAD499|nr:dnaJ homolog subfamily C member 7 homolog isoform X1 [Syzygium oleosum]